MIVKEQNTSEQFHRVSMRKARGVVGMREVIRASELTADRHTHF